jgi:WD40 repeat protein
VFRLSFALALLGMVGGCDAQEGTAAAPPSTQASQSSQSSQLPAPSVTAKIQPTDIKNFGGIQAAVAFSPDGETLATVGDEGIVRLFDTSNGVMRKALPKMRSFGTALAFSRTGKYIAAGGIEGSLTVWEASSGHEVQALKTDGEIRALSFQDNDSTIVAAGWNSPVPFARGWNISGGKQVFETKYEGHPFPGAAPPYSVKVSTMAISPDGKWLATASESTIDLNVRVWDLRGGKERDHLGITYPVMALGFSPDSKILCAGDDVGKVHLWDENGRNIAELYEHNDPVNAVAFSPDGKLVATPAQRGVDVWDVSEKKLRNTFMIDIGAVRTLAFSPDSKFIAMSDNLSKLHIREADEVTKAQNPEPDFHFLNERRPTPPAQGTVTWRAHERTIDSLAFSPDGKLLASAAEERAIKLWDSSTHKLLQTILGMRAAPTSIAFSPDGKIIACGCASSINGSAGSVEPPNEIKFFEAATGKDLGWIETQENSMPAVAFTKDGKSVYASDKDGVVHMYDLAKFRPRDGFELNLRGEQLHSIAVSPDGKELALGTFQGPAGKLIVCSAETGRERFVVDYDKGVKRISYSPNGRWIALVTGNVQIVDNQDGSRVREIEHRYYSGGAEFVPGGKLLASCAMEGTIHLWTVGGDWRERANLPRRPGVNDVYTNLTVSPDGKLIAVSNTDEIVIWPVPQNAQ